MKKKMPKQNKTVRNDDSWGYETAFEMPMNGPLSGVFGTEGRGSALSSQGELQHNISYSFVSMNRVICTYAYTTHGVLRTLVDQPVQDAFRGGLIFKSDELDENDIQELNKYMKKNHIYKIVRDALRWDRLYGGAGLIINTSDDYTKPFKKDKIKEDSPLMFIPADRWELAYEGLPYGLEQGLPDQGIEKSATKFNYYGKSIDSSRVIKIVGEEAPALARRRLQGWGMSVIECVLREINQYLKNQNVLFELLDEAKIDVYKLKDFNSKVLSKLAQGKVVRRITIANSLKNFANAIMIDSEDEYEQKQLTLTGIADTLVQIRIGIAAAVRMPVTKLFGISSAGFNSGEDDIENYNTLVEHERERADDVLDVVMPLICLNLFGFEPELDWEWKPLRVLSAIDEENVKNSKFNRHSTLWSQGFYTDEEYARSLKEDKLVLMDTEVSKGTREVEPPMNPSASWQNPQQVANPKKVTEEA